MVALANVIWAMAALALDLPSSLSFKLLTPITLIGVVYVVMTQARRGDV